MNEKLMAEKNKILEIVSGSHLYGTSTPESDADFIGVFMPDEEYVLGFKKCEEVDFSIISKDASGKNTKEALDRKLYEFRKYISLAKQNNPNILEMLFVNEENIIFINDFGKELLSIKHLFPYKGLKERFVGYAMSQKHKAIIKKDNYFNLISGLDYLSRFNDDKYIVEVTMDNCPPFITTCHNEEHNCKFVCIGDLNITPSKTIKVVKKMIQDRLDKVGNREELLLKYGVDTKFLSHLIRLLFEGIELLKTGEIVFPLKERNILMDIRSGKWETSRIFDFSYELEKEIDSIVDESKLPSSPNYDEIEKFTMTKLRNWILK
jgi:hypothetical protein